MSAIVAVMMIGVIAGGCGERPEERRALSGDSGDLSDLEWGEDAPAPRAAGGRSGPASASAQAGRPDTGSSSRWTILLRTFRADDPEEAPMNFVRSCASVEPRLASAQILRRGTGRIVTYGEYRSSDDRQAQRDLEWIQKIEFRGRPLLPRVMMTRINMRHLRGEYLPNELLSVRVERPTQHPLYSLQVEVWGDFGSRTMTLEQVQRRAEARVRELRAKGYRAFFHHDDDQMLSSISIGLFDGGAWDAQSGILLDPLLRQLMKDFPAHLINGEPVEELIDPRNPRRGGVTQVPTLVEVPRW